DLAQKNEPAKGIFAGCFIRRALWIKNVGRIQYEKFCRGKQKSGVMPDFMLLLGSETDFLP
ncbi:MAG: hypothetical protein ACI4RO_00185, partial [Candidatus Scatosoma sp.]